MFKKFLRMFSPIPISIIPLDPINNPYAKAMTPDELIAAAIIKSFAEDFDDWRKFGSLSTEATKWGSVSVEGQLLKGHTRINFRLSRQQKGSYDNRKYWYELVECIINDIPLELNAGKKLFEAWIKISAEVHRAKAIAEKAKADMQANEAKWNLAEKLLGMKRDENGALVPVTRAEE